MNAAPARIADGEHVVLLIDTAFTLACDQIRRQYEIKPGKASATRTIERTDIPHILLTAFHYAGEHLFDEMGYTGKAEAAGYEQECEAVARAFRNLRTPLTDEVDGQTQIGHVCVIADNTIQSFQNMWFENWPDYDFGMDTPEDEDLPPMPGIPFEQIGVLILHTLHRAGEWIKEQWDAGKTEAMHTTIRQVGIFFWTLTY